MRERDPFYRVCRAGLRLLARGLFRLEVWGSDGVPATGGIILAANHVSLLDPIVVGASLQRSVHYLGKEELFRSQGLAWLLRHLHAIPVSRDRLSPSTVKGAARLLEEGKILLVFPEGTRGDGRVLGAGRPGIGVLAARTGVPTVPVFHCGAERILPRGARWPRRGRLRVWFGLPLRFVAGPGDEREAIRRFSEQVMGEIARLREAGLAPGRPLASAGVPSSVSGSRTFRSP